MMVIKPLEKDITVNKNLITRKLVFKFKIGI